MLHKNIMIYAIAVLTAITFMLPVTTQEYNESIMKSCFTTITDSLANLNTINAPERGLSRNEMLRRFGSANVLVMEYDRELKTDVTRFYYRIDDSDIFLEFVSSWEQNQDIVGFSMKEGYCMLYFTDYGK